MTLDPAGKVARLKRANPSRPFDSKGGRLPPGQYLTEKFPVLHYGSVRDSTPRTGISRCGVWSKIPFA
jgi:hypothetical protein